MRRCLFEGRVCYFGKARSPGDGEPAIISAMRNGGLWRVVALSSAVCDLSRTVIRGEPG